MRIALASLAVLLAAVGCKSEEAKGPAASKPAVAVQIPAPGGPAAAVPADFVLKAEPEGAKDLVAVKAAAAAGDDVVARCVLGGTEQPFGGQWATVQVIDPTVMTCNKMGMADCPTPWDACCHQKEAKAKGASVRVVGADGKPLAGTLQGVGGMKPGSEVVVKGKAKFEGDGEKKSLVIEASNVWVKG
ncbi:MAG TPA: hypothetical protein VF796_15245 [Humisphaera sp.]